MGYRIAFVYLVPLLYGLSADGKYNSKRFALRRSGIRIEDAIVSQESSVQPSLLVCAALCNSSCNTVSFHTKNGRCLLSTMDISAYSFPRNMVSGENWITISNARFTVYNRKGPNGHYSTLWEDAASVCERDNTTMASEADLLRARDLGMHVCACAWMTNGNDGFVLQHADGCWGDYHTGVLYCGAQRSNVWCLF